MVTVHRSIITEGENADYRAALKADICGIPLHLSVSQVKGYLKGKDKHMIFDRYAGLKCRYGNWLFWYCACCVDMIGKKTAIAEYIYNKLVEDEMMEQMTIKECTFVSSKKKK